MATRSGILVRGTVAALVLLAAAAGVAGGPLGFAHSAAGTPHAQSIGYHLGNQAATGGGRNGFTATGGGGNGTTATGGGGNGVAASG